MASQLKLIALDADDLAVISAHVQDARVQTSDIIWRQGEKRLVVGMSRLDWEQTLAGETAPRRLIAALRFDRVLACKSRNIDLEAPEAALELVGIEFHPGDAPSGSALLMFSDGAALRRTGLDQTPGELFGPGVDVLDGDYHDHRRQHRTRHIGQNRKQQRRSYQHHDRIDHH